MPCRAREIPFIPDRGETVHKSRSETWGICVKEKGKEAEDTGCGHVFRIRNKQTVHRCSQCGKRDHVRLETRSALGLKQDTPLRWMHPKELRKAGDIIEAWASQTKRLLTVLQAVNVQPNPGDIEMMRYLIMRELKVEEAELQKAFEDRLKAEFERQVKAEREGERRYEIHKLEGDEEHLNLQKQGLSWSILLMRLIGVPAANFSHVTRQIADIDQKLQLIAEKKQNVQVHKTPPGQGAPFTCTYDLPPTSSAQQQLATPPRATTYILPPRILQLHVHIPGEKRDVMSGVS